MDENTNIFLEALDEAGVDLDDLGLDIDDLDEMDPDELEEILANIEIEDEADEDDEDDEGFEITIGPDDEEEEN